MFLDKYLSDIKLKLLYDVYEEEFINNLDENNFIEVYNIFKKYGFTYIDDIIRMYLIIFTYDFEYVEEVLVNIINSLGDDYLSIISKDLRLLSSI